MRAQIARKLLRNLGGLILVVFGSTSFAYSGEPWVRIEEDWQLRLTQPDPHANSPQLTTYLTPDANNLASYFQLQLNHAAEADFSGGGFRVSAVNGDQPGDEARSQTRSLLSYDNDVVEWTTVMAAHENKIYFAVKNGTSSSWGEFGGQAYLVAMPSEGVCDFRFYTPTQSVSDVDIGYGRNRVGSLKLIRVRAYRDDGSCETVETNLDAT